MIALLCLRSAYEIVERERRQRILNLFRAANGALISRRCVNSSVMRLSLTFNYLWLVGS